MLGYIESVIANLVCYLETAGVGLLNLLISGLAGVASAILSALPDFPTITVPTQITDGYAFGAYWFPLDWFFTELGIFVVLALAWFAAAIGLRWVKVVRGNQ